jgi:hypothetical protein
MKKNILIGILTICFMTSLGYGVIQQSEAENQRKRADEMEAKAIENERLAREQQQRAEKVEQLIVKHARLAEARKDSVIRQWQESEKRRKK